MDVDLHHPHHLALSHPQHHLQDQLHINQHPSQQQQQQRQQQHQQSMNPSTSTSSPNANSSVAAGTGATSSGVMTASGTATATAAGGPQIRSRITVVCAECKRLKLKCDRRAPCGSCMKRDTVVRCIYSPAAAEKVDLHSLNNRLIQVEAILAMLTSGQQPAAPFQSAYPYPYPTSLPGPSNGSGNIHANANASNNGLGPSTSVGGGIPLVLPGSLPTNFLQGGNGHGGASVENAEAANGGSWSGKYALGSAADYPPTSLPGANGPRQSHPNLNHNHQHHEHHHHYAAPHPPPSSSAQRDRLGMAPEDVVSIWLDDLDQGVAKEWLGDAVVASSSDRIGNPSTPTMTTTTTTTNGTAVHGSVNTTTATNMTMNTTATSMTTTTNTTTHANDLGYNFEYAFDGSRSTANANENANPAGYIKLEPSSVDVEFAPASFQYSYPNPYPSASVSASDQRENRNNTGMVIDLDGSDVTGGGNSTMTATSTFASTSTAHVDSTPALSLTSNSNSISPPRHQQHILLPALSIYYPLPSIPPPGTSPSSSAAFPAVSVPASIPPRPAPIPQPHPHCPPSPSSHSALPLSPSNSGGGTLSSTSLTLASTPASGGTSGGYVFPPFSSPPTERNVIQIGSQPQPQSPFHQQQHPHHHHPFNINTTTSLASKDEMTKIKTKPQITPALLSLLPSVERCRALLKDARSVVLGVRCVPLVPLPVSLVDGDVDGDSEKEKEIREGYGKMWDAFECRCVFLLSGSPDGVLGSLSAEKERERVRERERERERERAKERIREKERRQRAKEARRARQIYFGGIAGLGGGQRAQREDVDADEEDVDDEKKRQRRKDDEHEHDEDVEDTRRGVDSSLDNAVQEEDRLSEEDLDDGYFAEERGKVGDEEREDMLESLPFFATMCAVLAIGAAISNQSSGSSLSSTSLSPQSSLSSPQMLPPLSQHSSSSPNPTPAFLYALSQQALDVWDAHSRPDADSMVQVPQRTEYVLGHVVGIIYLLLRMSGSGSSAQDVAADEMGLDEEERTREREKEKECIRVLMNKMVSAARDAGLEVARDGASFSSLQSSGKAPYSARSGAAKSSVGVTKKRGAGTETKTKTSSNSKAKPSISKGKKSKLSWERERERSAAAIVNAQEEWRRMVLWEVMFYDLFTSDMLGHEPYIPSSVYASVKLPTCSSASSSGDGDCDLEDDEHQHEGVNSQRLGVDGHIYAYLGARYSLARISSLVKARMADPECCCGYTLDQASKLEEEIVKWNRWSIRRMVSPSSSSSSSASSSSTLASSKASDEDDNDDRDEDATLLLAQRAELAVWANILVVKIYTPFLRHAALAASSSSSSPNLSTSSSSQRQRQRQQHMDSDLPASINPALTAAYQTTVRAAQAIVRAAQCVMKTSSLGKSPLLAKYTAILPGHGQQGRGHHGRVADSEVEVGAALDVPMDMGVDMTMPMDNPLDVDMEIGVGVGASVDVGLNIAVDVGLDVGLDADHRQAVAQARKIERNVKHDTNQTIQDPFALHESPRNSGGSASRVAIPVSSAQNASQKHARPKARSSQVLPAFFDFYPLEKVVFDAVVICAHAGLELAPRPAPGRSLFASSSASSLYSSTEFDPSPATGIGKAKGKLNPILDDLDAGLNILSDLCGPAAGRGWGWGWGRRGVGEAQKRVMEVLYHRAGALRPAGPVGGRAQPSEHHDTRYGHKIHTIASPNLIGNNNAHGLKRKHDQISLGGSVPAQAVPRSFADERLVVNSPRHPSLGEITLSPPVDLSTTSTSISTHQPQQTQNPYPFARTITIPDASNDTNASPTLPDTPSSHSSVANFPQDLMQRNERQKLELTSALTSVVTARLSAAAAAAKERERDPKKLGKERERIVLEDSSEGEKEKERKHPRKSVGSSHRPAVGVRMRHGVRDELGGTRARAGSGVGGIGEGPLPLMTSKPRPFPPSTNAMDTANSIFAQKQKTQIPTPQQPGVMLVGDHDETDSRHRSRSSSFVQSQIPEQQQPQSLSQYHHPLTYNGQTTSDNVQRNKFPVYDTSSSVRQQQNQLSPVHSPFTPRSVFDHTHTIHNNALYDQTTGPQAHAISGFSPYESNPTSSGDSVPYNNDGNVLVSSPFSSASIGAGGNPNGPPSSSGSPFTTSSVTSSSGGGPHPSTPTFNAINHPTSPPLFGSHTHLPPTANNAGSLAVSAAASPVVGYFHAQGGPFDHQGPSLSGMEHHQQQQQHHVHHHQQQPQQTHLQHPHSQQVGSHGHGHEQISLGDEMGMDQNMIALADNNAVLYDKHPQPQQHSQQQQHIYDVKAQSASHLHFLQHAEERQQNSLSQPQHPSHHHHHQLSMGPPGHSHTGYEDNTMDISSQNPPMSLGMAVSSAWPTAGNGNGAGAGQEQQQQQTQAVQQNTQSFWGNDPGYRFYS